MRTFFALAWIFILLSAGCLAVAQSHGEKLSAKVALEGESKLDGTVNGQRVRIILTTYKIDIGTPSQAPPQEHDNNCTYSRFPCSQVKSLRIWVNGVRLRVPKSSYLDCADVGTMTVEAESKDLLLQLIGGDASEGYSVKIAFDTHRVEKRSVYWTEGNDRLLETTTYMPPIVVN
jgi:hypothetical protein